MPELRWTLLILGALFIGALALWELRRQRHARGQSPAPGHEQGHEGERVTPTLDGTTHVREGGRVFREPTLTFPDVHLSVERRSEPRDIDPMADPPVVEVDDPSLAGLRIEEQAAVDEFSEPDVDSPRAARVEPMIPELAPAELQDREPSPTSRSASFIADEEVGPVSVRAEPASNETDAQAAFDAPTIAYNVVEPIVEWPDEDTRRIVALRLVSSAGGRFSGRSVRLALSAEGFFLGKFDIFHKPGPDARAVLSAASLTKPGTFSLSTMDAQRYGGISLFAVLPGPLSPGDTFDELLATARSLNDRLRGALQDERGEPLTPVRSASIRESLTSAAAAAAPVVQAATPPAQSDTSGDTSTV
jgi:FtsZ-interacting cell division protein ZipA